MVKNALQNGLILGGIAVVYALIMTFFMGGDSWLTMMLLGLGFFIVFIVLIIMWAIKYRKSQNNILSYGNALLYILIVWAVSSTMSSTFNFVYSTVINPDYAERIIDMSISQTEEWLVNSGMSDEEIEEVLIQVEEDTMNSFTFGGMLKSLLWGYVVAAIFSALISLFVWKRPPKETPLSISADES